MPTSGALKRPVGGLVSFHKLMSTAQPLLKDRLHKRKSSGPIFLLSLSSQKIFVGQAQNRVSSQFVPYKGKDRGLNQENSGKSTRDARANRSR